MSKKSPQGPFWSPAAASLRVRAPLSHKKGDGQEYNTQYSQLRELHFTLLYMLREF